MRVPEAGEDLKGKVCVDSAGRIVFITKKNSGEWFGMEVVKCPRVFVHNKRRDLAVAHESFVDYLNAMVN